MMAKIVLKRQKTKAILFIYSKGLNEWNESGKPVDNALDYSFGNGEHTAYHYPWTEKLEQKLRGQKTEVEVVSPYYGLSIRAYNFLSLSIPTRMEKQSICFGVFSYPLGNRSE